MPVQIPVDRGLLGGVLATRSPALAVRIDQLHASHHLRPGLSRAFSVVRDDRAPDHTGILGWSLMA